MERETLVRLYYNTNGAMLQSVLAFEQLTGQKYKPSNEDLSQFDQVAIDLIKIIKTLDKRAREISREIFMFDMEHNY